MKEKITAFLHGLISYDYMLFGAIFMLFFLLLLIAILLRNKTGISIFFVLLSFIVLIIGPLVGYSQLHNYLFKASLTLKSEKRLNFTPAIVVRGTLKNESKFDFEKCKIVVNVHKVSKNKLKNYLYSFKILKKMSISEEDIQKGDVRDFKIIVEPFTYKHDYNISLKASCK